MSLSIVKDQDSPSNNWRAIKNIKKHWWLQVRLIQRISTRSSLWTLSYVAVQLHYLKTGINAVQMTFWFHLKVSHANIKLTLSFVQWFWRSCIFIKKLCFMEMLILDFYKKTKHLYMIVLYTIICGGKAASCLENMLCWVLVWES